MGVPTIPLILDLIIDSDLLRMTAFGMREAMDTLVAGQPSGRVGKPEDFGGVILFLSSAAAAHMTGNVIELDGGSTLSGFRSKKKNESRM